MRSGTRRGMLAAFAFASAGCLGPELSYDDTPPSADENDASDDDFDASSVRDSIAFAGDTIVFLVTAEETLMTWEASPEAVHGEEINELSVVATQQLTTYDRTVAPYRDELARIERGDELDGETWDIDGSALADALAAQESLLFSIEEAAIAIMDADGDPDGVTAHGWSMIETIQQQTEPVQSATAAALGDHA